MDPDTKSSGDADEVSWKPKARKKLDEKASLSASRYLVPVEGDIIITDKTKGIIMTKVKYLKDRQCQDSTVEPRQSLLGSRQCDAGCENTSWCFLSHPPEVCTLNPSVVVKRKEMKRLCFYPR